MTPKRDPLYQGKILNLVKLEDRWEVVEHAPAVCVLVLRGDRGDEVLGVRQYRPAIGSETWELPAGLVDPDETPLEAAARELAEEAQLAGTLTLITQLYSSPGFCTEKVYIYEASNLCVAEGQLDAGEVLTLEWRNLQATWQAVREGRLQTSAHAGLALSVALARRGFFS